MKRFGVISFLVLVLMALMVPVASAHGGHGSHDGGGRDKHHRGHHGHHGGRGQQTPTFTASASNVAPGEVMQLHADITNADTTVKLTVTAVAHLPSQDISMPLTVTPGQAGFTADGTVGIGGEEPPGPVSVDFTFEYGGTITLVTVVAEIAITT
jgi:hypothetical protein